MDLIENPLVVVDWKSPEKAEEEVDRLQHTVRHRHQMSSSAAAAGDKLLRNEVVVSGSFDRSFPRRRPSIHRVKNRRYGDNKKKHKPWESMNCGIDKSIDGMVSQLVSQWLSLFTKRPLRSFPPHHRVVIQSTPKTIIYLGACRRSIDITISADYKITINLSCVEPLWKEGVAGRMVLSIDLLCRCCFSFFCSAGWLLSFALFHAHHHQQQYRSVVRRWTVSPLYKSIDRSICVWFCF